MNVLEKFANIDKKFAWSFLGFVLAVFFGGLTIYNEFIKVYDPQMVVEILSDTNVLDLKENLPELKILYGDVDIKSVGKDLSVVVFRIKNVGGTSILVGFYDANSPVEITLSHGEFLKFENIDSSNEYLKKLANATKISSSSIRMPNVIMEPGESYTLKALIIHGARTGTLIKSSGKIAGMRNIPIIRVETSKGNESFLSKVIFGSIDVHAFRAILYLGVVILVLFAGIEPSVLIWELLQERARKKSIYQFKKHISDPLPEGHETVFECYLNNGLAPLVRARKMLSDTENLKDALEKHSQLQRLRDEEGIIFVENPDYEKKNGKRYILIVHRVIRKLGIVKIGQDGSVQVDASKESFLGRFIDYIAIKES